MSVAYGSFRAVLQRWGAAFFTLCASALLALAGFVLMAGWAQAQGKAIQIVAFGDSLSAGYQLPQEAAFPARLEAALKAKGYQVQISNAGVSGDTASDGQDRLDWSVPEGTDLVVLELGANDMLRGLDPAVTQEALGHILERLAARHIAVLLCGMRAAPNLGADYGGRFEAIYPALAQRYHVPLYGFFLEGMARDPGLTLADGMHPNPAGVEVIVAHILPSIEALLKR